MSYLCDWCLKPIKDRAELFHSSHQNDEGTRGETSDMIEPDKPAASFRIHSEVPEHYHKHCAGAFVVSMIKADIPELPTRATR